jgi:2-amino-4-hydroxy-6-hydroxymethyldihydropteridine diphosphokinase
VIKQDILENQVKSVILGIGSNLGNKKLNIEKAKSKLEDFQIKIIKCSSKYESLSWPDIKKPKYINIIIKVETEIKHLELL